MKPYWGLLAGLIPLCAPAFEGVDLTYFDSLEKLEASNPVQFIDNCEFLFKHRPVDCDLGRRLLRECRAIGPEQVDSGDPCKKRILEHLCARAADDAFKYSSLSLERMNLLKKTFLAFGSSLYPP